ncbi:MAG: hypothetical protein WBB69_08090 [Anaerolineales bacterium]
MKRIKQGYILPSAAYVLKRKQTHHYREIVKSPEIGDVVYGVIERVGQHSSLENVSGRIHIIRNGTKVFLYMEIDMPLITMKVKYQFLLLMKLT